MSSIPVRRDPQNVGLPLSETTIADRLKSAGYATGIVGKWHLGGASQVLTRSAGDSTSSSGSWAAPIPISRAQGAPIYRGTEVVKEEAYLTDAFAREAVSFVERHKNDPFFLYLAFNAVHTPMHATDDRLAAVRVDQRRVAADVCRDAHGAGRGRWQGAGQLCARRGSKRDTLIVFFSDNGGPTMRGTTINASRNDPLRGSKRTTLEGGIRVPFVVRWKGSLPEGVVYEQPVIQLDVLPTVLAAAGVKAEPEWKLDGVNLLPYVKGEISGTPHDALYWRLGEQTAIRRGDWKLVRYDRTVDETGTESDARAEAKVTQPRLYNLARDVGEKEDLASSHPEKVEELQDLWNSWAAQLKEPLWGPGRRIAAATP